LFDRILAVKNGASHPVEGHRLEDVLQCSNCGQVQWEMVSGAMKCERCENQLSITDDAIVLN
jgi:hypothetical protein